jgi:hypothetical protein
MRIAATESVSSYALLKSSLAFVELESPVAFYLESIRASELESIEAPRTEASIRENTSR